MGKKSSKLNQALNVSLSYTLDHLQTHVLLEDSPTDADIYNLKPDGPDSESLGPEASLKFSRFVEVLKKEFQLESQFFKISSVNNFPSDCGLASSASSLMALTEALHEKYKAQHQKEIPHLDRALLSRQGSGSSCRSFFKPFSIWDGDQVTAVNLPVELLHMVIVVDKKPKAVSSTQAHQRVQSSLLLKDREQRARMRMGQLIGALQSDWKKAFEICWAEFWDMHGLFETSMPPFGYLGAESLKVLEELRQSWELNQDGPLVTMDAGPNIHLLFRSDQKELWNQNLQLWKSRYECHHS